MGIMAMKGYSLFLRYMRNREYPFIAIIPKSTLTRSNSTCYGVSSMGQINMFKNYSYSIGPRAKKTIEKQERTMNAIP